jgi:FAD/FMN-containing dehydrogenase
LIVDGTLAQDSTQAKAIWSLRESITSGLACEGAVYKYDISLPVTTMYDMVLKTKARLGNKVGGVVGYGHLGDGNLHLNIYTKKYEPEVLAMIEPWLFEQTGEKGIADEAEGDESR